MNRQKHGKKVFKTCPRPNFSNHMTTASKDHLISNLDF